MRHHIVACALALAASVATAGALTFTVTKTADTADGACDADCSLREAVIAANAHPGADTIVVPAGIYTLTLTGAGEDAAATGDLDITDDCTITGAGADRTVIDGAGADRIFEVQYGTVSATIAGLTLRNGGSVDSGGAILVRGSSNLAVEDCAFIHNWANIEGGAIEGWGSVAVSSCSFSGNATGSYGGAVSVTTSGTIESSTFAANRATYGGGALIQSNGSSLQVDASTLVGNEASYGGGIHNDRGTTTFTNVTFAANFADSSAGGAASTSGGSTTFNNCTLADNARVGDGAAIDGLNGAAISLENTIVSGGGASTNCNGPITSVGHNIDSGDGCGFTSAGDLVDTAPGLAPLAPNGGFTWTEALRSGSPAIDTGSAAFPPTDQRGVTRPQGAAADIGAYEATGVEPPIGAPVTVPVIAHVSGVGGTPWRADVSLTNPSANPLPLALRYTPSTANVITHAVTLNGHETLLLEDVVASLFGAGDGRGGLELVPPTVGPTPSVLTRTFAVQGGERLGQGMPALEPLPAGSYFLPGLVDDDSYRSNIAVTSGAADVQAAFTLFRGSDGAVGGTVTKTIPAGTQVQWRLPDLFPGLAQPDVPMTVRVDTDGAAIPYASLVDQVSTDAVTVVAQRSGAWWVIPVVAHLSGVGGTFWRTDLSLFNPGPIDAEVDLEFLAENTDNSGGGATAAPVVVPALSTVTVADVAQALFGVTGAKGSLVVVGSPQIVVTSRTYTTRTGGGTYGLGVPAVEAQAFSPRRKVVAGVRNADGYRTNIGFVGGSSDESFTVSLRGADGTVLATNSVSVPQRSMEQSSLDDLFGAAASGLAIGSVDVAATGQPLLVYVSVVDGSSQDPIYAVVTPAS
jgi:CSLREA domain-containing protein